MEASRGLSDRRAGIGAKALSDTKQRMIDSPPRGASNAGTKRQILSEERRRGPKETATLAFSARMVLRRSMTMKPKDAIFLASLFGLLSLTTAAVCAPSPLSASRSLYAVNE